MRPFNRPSHSPSDIGLPHSTLRWALVHVCTCRKIHLYGESKKSTHGHQTHLPARTHQSKTASECVHKGAKPTEAAGKAAALLLQQCARRAVTVGAGAVAPVCPLQLRRSRTPFFLPSHSPSDIGLPHSTLWWALVHVCACRQIRLYGEPKKSTHGHQTHLPARTHQRHFASGLSPPPRPPTTRARQVARKKLG